jgi:hypothetical protein
LENVRTKILAASLTIVVGVLIVIGLMSLGSRDPRRNKLPRIDIAKLNVGKFAVEDGETFRYFVVRPMSGELFVLAAPLVDGAVPMPDQYWWRPVMRCKQFGIEPNDGVVRETSHFRCADSEQPPEWSERWHWNLRGQAMDASTSVPSLYRVRIEQSHNEIVLLALDE